MRRLLLSSLLLLTGVAAAPAGASTLSTPVTVELLGRQSTVAAFGQTVAWSRWDAATSRYQLVADTGDGVARVLPVAPRSIAFDVDLGPDPAGRTVAVYSRCSTEPSGDYFGQKLWPNNAAGCRIYRFDFATGTERRLANLSGGNEFLPSIWKGRVAFLRAYGAYDPLGWRDPVLYTHSLTGHESSRRQSQGSTAGLDRIGFTGIDLYGDRLALTRRFIGTYDGGTSQMRVTTVGSGSRLVQQANSGLTQRILRSPQFHHGRVLWLTQCAADTGGCTSASYRLWRSRIAENHFSWVGAPRWLGSTAYLRDTVYWVQDARGFGYDGVNACQGSDPPDPSARCAVQHAFVTFSGG